VILEEPIVPEQPAALEEPIVPEEPVVSETVKDIAETAGDSGPGPESSTTPAPTEQTPPAQATG
ncbi:hypothetical protein CRUP_036212, partial [Coryphaenoides rupestris]